MDDILRKLRRRFRKAADFLRSKADEGLPFIIRFNNDADGIAAALSIRKALLTYAPGLRLKDAQNNSAVYSIEDARSDVSWFRINGGKGCAILLDFAANYESVPALEYVRSSSSYSIIIDHHPFDRRASSSANMFVSPWLAGGGSEYTSSLLSGEIAREVAPVDVDILQRIGLYGDRSSLIRRNSKKFIMFATALDFMAAERKHRLKTYERVLEDPKLVEEIHIRAMARVEEIRSLLKRRTKRKHLENDFWAFLLDFRRIGRWRGFPAKGTVMNILLDMGRRKAPLVCIGYGEDFVSFRGNRLAEERGFNATVLIKKLKSEFSELILGGGGHALAASMRTKKGYGSFIAGEALTLISTME